MLPHAPPAAHAATEASNGVNLEQLADHQPRRGGEQLVARDAPTHDPREHIHLRAAVEWRLACDELIEQDAQRPPIDRRRVAGAADSLGREVLGRAADGEGAVLDDLRKAKVHHLQRRAWCEGSDK